MGRGAWGQLCQLTTPQCAQQLYLSTGPAAIFIWNATGAESLRGNFRAVEEHDLDVLFTVNLLLCSLLTFSRGPCYLLSLSLLLLTSHCLTTVMLGSSSLRPSRTALSGLFPTAAGSRYVFTSLSKGAVSLGEGGEPSSGSIIHPACSLGHFVGFPTSPPKAQPLRAAEHELLWQGQEQGTPLFPPQKGALNQHAFNQHS